ncbi:flagellar basal body rod protein FlgF [Chitinasiproducens palmae]|uniref:Flagellar basal-body rod protein FlgF n=1 Tax=Chitinasiproducens palmae TaxID=1770053 RepID=A0A1H2PKI0_9BURK|nr:flagellar basal body rod protein FlgF [Chitinasiproducens palmae]SDV46952.1 flagellar basal-body rod protein FlgF [Chitinasiproducens palmae]
MDAFIYTSMAGAARAMRSLEVHANNLANAETDGFRADLELAEDVPVAGSRLDARRMVRSQARSSMDAGTMVRTGRDLDLAIEGTGYFTVAGRDGEAYTRAGGFDVDGAGQLVLHGRAVLGMGGPIVLPEFERVFVGDDGTVSVTVPDEPTPQVVDRLLLVDPAPGTLRKDQYGLLVSADGASLPASDAVKVLGGVLEGSNVSPVDELAAAMSASRSFELQMRLYRLAGSMAEAGERLVRG